MSEQFSSSFDSKKENSYEKMSLEELRVRYREHVGLPSRPVPGEREIMIQALNHPRETEVERLRLLDLAEDQDDRRNRR